MRKHRKGVIAQWKGKSGRTNRLRCLWCPSEKWWIIPTIHIGRVFDPLTITIHFLKLNLEYHSVMSYTIDEFKQVLKDHNMNINKTETGYFER